MKTKLLRSRAFPISKAFVAALFAPLFCLSVIAQTQEAETFPEIPREELDSYTLTQVTERIESMDVPMLRVSGNGLTFVMNPIPNHSADRAPKDVSLRLTHYANPQLQVELASFKAADFGYDFNEATLRQYLQGIQMQYAAEQNFEVLLEPVITTGPSRFRFLGVRSIPLRYRFNQEDDDLTREENWFLIDGTIHVISVQGFSRSFEGYFQSIRIPFNSSNSEG